MKFRIATPERIVLETEADSVTLPTQMGEITVLPNHIPLVANLVAGEVRYKSQNRENFFAISGGILEVKKDKQLVILADTAEFGHEIDIERAEKAREAAQKLMTEKSHDKQAFADAAAAFQKHLVRLKVARKHHSHHGTKVGD